MLKALNPKFLSIMCDTLFVALHLYDQNPVQSIDLRMNVGVKLAESLEIRLFRNGKWSVSNHKRVFPDPEYPSPPPPPSS